jgi:predicted amidohydrolase YtcJ
MKHFIFLLVAVTMVMTASSQNNADLIIYNGKVATMTRSGEFEQAVAMKDGIILAVGSSSQILSA